MNVKRRWNRGPSMSGDRDSRTLTTEWFDPSALEAIARRYEEYVVHPISYATARDYVDSFEHLRPLASAQGDMKDVQRPWVLKAVLATIPRGGRLLEIGGGEPYVADIAARLGYEVWLVDPYDGSGNGPVEYDQFRRACPGVTFVRARFDDLLEGVPEGAFDCIFSISVLEHLSIDEVNGVFRGMDRFLTPTGRSIHAIDHICRGRGDNDDLVRLQHIGRSLGIPRSLLDDALRDVGTDPETYYLSVESHNRWRMYLGLAYAEYPMFSCVSIQIASARSMQLSE